MSARLECDRCSKSTEREMKHPDGSTTGTHRSIFSVIIYDVNDLENFDSAYRADWCTECIGLDRDKNKWYESLHYIHLN